MQAIESLALSSGSTRQQAGQDSENAIRLWQAFAQMYGHAFVSQYGEKPDSLWARLVNTLDDEALRRGMKACVEAGGEFPPSLPKFMEYCNPKPAGVRFLGSPVASGYLLDSPKATRETAKKHIDAMRRRLKGE